MAEADVEIVVKVVVREKWVTISEIAVLLEASAAMAEILGVMRARKCPRSDPLQEF